MAGRKRVYAGKTQRRSRKKQAIVKAKSAKSFTARGPTSAVLQVSCSYADTYTLNPGALGATASQVFRLQSLHDPDYTGVGHQANGYDQLYGLYERYLVHRVDFEIEFVSNDGSNIQGCGYRFNDENLTDTDFRTNMESGLGEFTVLSAQGGMDRKTYSGSVRCCDIHGVTMKQYMGEQNFGANFGSNAGSDSWLTLWADGNGTDTAGVIARVRLTYHAKLEGSKLTALS